MVTEILELLNTNMDQGKDDSDYRDMSIALEEYALQKSFVRLVDSLKEHISNVTDARKNCPIQKKINEHNKKNLLDFFQKYEADK